MRSEPTWRGSIAAVEVGDPIRAFGTAFLVAPGYALTARHVVRLNDDPSGGPEAPPVRLHFPEFSVGAQVTLENASEDWALLRLDRELNVPPLLLGAPPRTGTTVRIFGFPAVQSEDGMVFSGVVRDPHAHWRRAQVLQLYSDEAAAGAGPVVDGLSGAPVLLEGVTPPVAVGLLRSVLGEVGVVAGTLYAVPAHAAHEACRSLLPPMVPAPLSLRVPWPVALAILSGAALVAAVALGPRIAAQHDIAYYLELLVSWICLLPWAAARWRQGQRHLAVSVGGLGLLIALGCGSYWYHEWRLKETTPASPVPLLLPLGALMPAAHADPGALTLGEIFVDDHESNYIQSLDPRFGAGPKVPTYSMDRALFLAQREGQCTGYTGDQPMVAVLPVLHRLLDARGTPQLIPYITSKNALAHVTAARGEIFQQVVPTQAEFLGLPASDQRLVKEWLLRCVGLYAPVLGLTVTNRGSMDAMLLRVVYDVQEVGQVMGGESSLVVPSQLYDHTLIHAVGEQPHALDPALRLASGQSVTLKLRLSSDRREPGLGWYLRIRVEDDLGRSVTSDYFQIFMGKALGG